MTLKSAENSHRRRNKKMNIAIVIVDSDTENKQKVLNLAVPITIAPRKWSEKVVTNHSLTLFRDNILSTFRSIVPLYVAG